MKSLLQESLTWRYATKAFDKTKKISTDDWNLIEETLIDSPSSFGLQPWKFLVITNDEMKAKLRPHSWNQSQVTDCSHYVVFCAKKDITPQDVAKYVQRVAEVRGVSLSSLEDYKNLMNKSMESKGADKLMYTSRQVYISLGNAMTAASLLKIDTCPMEGFTPAEYNSILNIEPEYTSVVACAFGFRSEEDKYSKLPKVRFLKSDIIKHFN